MPKTTSKKNFLKKSSAKKKSVKKNFLKKSSTKKSVVKKTPKKSVVKKTTPKKKSVKKSSTKRVVRKTPKKKVSRKSMKGGTMTYTNFNLGEYRKKKEVFENESLFFTDYKTDFKTTNKNIVNILNDESIINQLNAVPDLGKVFFEDMIQSYYYKSLRTFDYNTTISNLGHLQGFLKKLKLNNDIKNKIDLVFSKLYEKPNNKEYTIENVQKLITPKSNYNGNLNASSLYNEKAVANEAASQRIFPVSKNRIKKAAEKKKAAAEEKAAAEAQQPSNNQRKASNNRLKEKLNKQREKFIKGKDS